MVTSESINSNIHDVIAINNNIFEYCFFKILFIVTSMMMSSIVFFIVTNVSIFRCCYQSKVFRQFKRVPWRSRSSCSRF